MGSIDLNPSVPERRENLLAGHLAEECDVINPNSFRVVLPRTDVLVHESFELSPVQTLIEPETRKHEGACGVGNLQGSLPILNDISREMIPLAERRCRQDDLFDCSPSFATVRGAKEPYSEAGVWKDVVHLYGACSFHIN